MIKYSVNFPLRDDFDTVLNFILQYNDGKTAIIDLFFSQHLEHRIFWVRILSLLQYKIFGQVNFTALIFLGNIGLFASVFVLYKILQPIIKNVFILPVIFMVIQANYWENITWATGSIQNFWVIFFVLSAIYFTGKSLNKIFYLFLALLCALLAIGTSGNGFLAFPLCILLLMINKKYLHGLLYLIIFLLCIYAYFHSYISPVTLSSKQNFSILEKILIIFKFGLLFLKRYSFGDDFFWVIYIFSIILAGYYVFRKKLESKHTTFYMSMLFFIISGVIIAYNRGLSDFNYVYSSRYTLYPNFFLAFIYALIISNLKGKTLHLYFTFIFLYCFILNIVSYAKAKDSLEDTKITLVLENCNIEESSLNYPGEKKNAFRIFNESLKKSIIYNCNKSK